MSITERLNEVKVRVGEACARVGRDASTVRIVAVTKAATADQIRQAVELGLHDLGENRAQVLEQHARELGPVQSVRWHMIGHLQRNKVRQVLSIVSMIQSVDSLRLAQEIERAVSTSGRAIPVLIEVNAGEEQQKSGAGMRDAAELAKQVSGMPHMQLEGLMTMAPLTEDRQLIRATFARTKELFEEVRSAGFVGERFRELSMGMSGDYELAIEQGATIIRIGSVLFS